MACGPWNLLTTRFTSSRIATTPRSAAATSTPPLVASRKRKSVRLTRKSWIPSRTTSAPTETHRRTSRRRPPVASVTSPMLRECRPARAGANWWSGGGRLVAALALERVADDAEELPQVLLGQLQQGRRRLVGQAEEGTPGLPAGARQLHDLDPAVVSRGPPGHVPAGLQPVDQAGHPGGIDPQPLRQPRHRPRRQLGHLHQRVGLDGREPP